MRRTLLALSTIVGLALAPACSDDDDNGKVTTDSGPAVDRAVNPATDGPITSNEGGVQQDGSTTQQDTGPTAGLDCVEILQCIQTNCPQSEASCIASCQDQGSAQASADFQALMTCMAQAGQGTGACAAVCTNPQSQECGTCLQQACETEFNTCTGAGGPPVEGFGASCDPQAQNCSGDMACLGLEGYEGAFCSPSCDNMGYPCPGAPEGTFAACVLQVQGGGLDGYYCAFLCKVPDGSGGTVEYDCPEGMTCDPQGNQGQHSCMPTAAQ